MLTVVSSREMLRGNPSCKATNRCRPMSSTPFPATSTRSSGSTQRPRISARSRRFDRYPDSVVPGPGGTSLHIVTFPPDSVFADPSFDAHAAQKEALVRLRGLADHFEKEDPGMHKTNTVDYSVVYDGEIWLELDDGETLHLRRGDVVVQNGTRHAWRNKGAKPVTMLFFLNGARA